MYKATFRDFFKLEAAGGILLLLAAAVAMVLKNSPFGEIYEAFLDTPIHIGVGALEIDKPLLHWVNDGLMAVFSNYLIFVRLFCRLLRVSAASSCRPRYLLWWSEGIPQLFEVGQCQPPPILRLLWGYWR